MPTPEVTIRVTWEEASRGVLNILTDAVNTTDGIIDDFIEQTDDGSAVNYTFTFDSAKNKVKFLEKLQQNGVLSRLKVAK